MFAMGYELGKWDFTAIEKLHKCLTGLGIEHSYHRLYDGYQVKTKTWDVVLHNGSYGHELGLLEGYGKGFGTEYDSVEGHLTLGEVLERVLVHE